MKRKIYNLVLIFIASCSIVGYFVSRNVSAQEGRGIDLTVSPVVLDLTVKPGQRIQDKIRLRNNLDIPVDLKLSVYKMEAKDEVGNVAPIEPTKGDDYISWLKFEKPEFTARAKEWIDVKLSIDVPETAGFGYYYAIKIAERDRNENELNETPKLKGEVLVPILLNVKKEGAKAEGKVIDFKAKKYINEYLPVEFSALFENTGNIHIKPKGNVFIKGFRNNDVAVLDINKTSGNVLPNTRRNFETSWDDGFFVSEPVIENGKVKTDAKGDPITKLTIHWNKLLSFRFGKYTAHLIMVYDNGDKDIPVEATTSFWVIPYKMLGILLLFIIALLILGRYLLKIYVNKQIQKYERRSGRV